ncbi:MAG: tetratricopeptide repeat protein [Oceanipulchritudo sp.]
MKNPLKRILFAAILVCLPVVLILLLAEGFLRLTGFGYATTPLIRVQAGGEAVWAGNPDFTRLYFPAALKRLPSPVRVPVQKPADTRRYMIVGGSAAAGDPDPDFSIARNLEWILSAAHPDINWEVLNLAYTACNSHVAEEVVRQSASYGLDGILVLVGNNEVIGPFGPGTTLTESLPPLWRRDMEIALRKTKLGQLGQILRERLAGGPANEEAWRGMQHFLEHRIAFGDPRLEQVYANFRANLEDMNTGAERRGIPILLANVPVNLFDQPPFQDDTGALPENLKSATMQYLQTGQSPLPLHEVLAAAQSYPQSAHLAWMAGRLLFEKHRTSEADAFLRRARDLDRLRFRADSRLNAIIEEEWEKSGTSLLPLDAEAPLIADNPRHALGFPHFYEHVHFSLRANFLIAWEMARALLGYENLDTTHLDNLDWTQAAAALAYTPYEAWLILEEIGRRFGQPPFTDIPGYGRLTAWMDTLRESLHARISTAEEKESMTGTYLTAIRNRPDDDRIKLNFANFLAAFERAEAAYAIMEELYPRNPTDSEVAIAMLNLSLKLGHNDKAREALARIERIFPEHPNLDKFRSEIRTAGK